MASRQTARKIDLLIHSFRNQKYRTQCRSCFLWRLINNKAVNQLFFSDLAATFDITVQSISRVLPETPKGHIDVYPLCTPLVISFCLSCQGPGLHARIGDTQPEGRLPPSSPGIL